MLTKMLHKYTTEEDLGAGEGELSYQLLWANSLFQLDFLPYLTQSLQKGIEKDWPNSTSIL